MPTLDQVFQLLLTYKYILIFPLAVLEGPILSVIAGFLISIHQLNFIVTLILVVLGDVFGDSILYSLGRKSGLHQPPTWLRFLGVTKERVEVLEKLFIKQPKKIFTIGKLTIGPGAAILFAAGVTKFKFQKFVFYNLLLSVVKLFILLLVGYYFGQAYTHIQAYLDYGAIFFVIIFIVIYILFIRYTRKVTSE